MIYDALLDAHEAVIGMADVDANRTAVSNAFRVVCKAKFSSLSRLNVSPPIFLGVAHDLSLVHGEPYVTSLRSANEGSLGKRRAIQRSARNCTEANGRQGDRLRGIHAVRIR